MNKHYRKFSNKKFKLSEVVKKEKREMKSSFNPNRNCLHCGQFVDQLTTNCCYLFNQYIHFDCAKIVLASEQLQAKYNPHYHTIRSWVCTL